MRSQSLKSSSGKNKQGSQLSNPSPDAIQTYIIGVVMPQTVYDKIDYLCRRISEVEWSGVLMYSTQGSIKDPSNMKITLEDVYLMDKGSHAFTQYELDSDFVDYRMDNPETLEWKMGHIHSHNNMAVFFSSTDNQELKDNAGNHNYYLSLIVNNRMEMEAKVAVSTDAQVEIPVLTYFARDEKGERYPMKHRKKLYKENVVYVYNCEIKVFNERPELPEHFTSRVEEVIEKSKKASIKKASFGNTSFTTGPSRVWIDSDPEYRYHYNYNKPTWDYNSPPKVSSAMSKYSEAETFLKKILGFENPTGNDKLKDIINDFINDKSFPDKGKISMVIELIPEIFARDHGFGTPDDAEDLLDLLNDVESVLEAVKSDNVYKWNTNQLWLIENLIEAIIQFSEELMIGMSNK